MDRPKYTERKKNKRRKENQRMLVSSEREQKTKENLLTLAGALGSVGKPALCPEQGQPGH